MQQTCQRCGFEPPPGSKFCRQCGAPLVTETEASSADTRNYGRQSPAPFSESAPPPSQPSYSPPSVADAFSNDTARMPQTPPPPIYQQPYPPVPAYPTAPKSNWWKWALGVAFVLLLVCGGVLVYAVRQATDFGKQMQGQVQEAIRKAEEEAAKAGQPSGAPPPAPGAPPPPPPPGGGTALNLDKLKYPGSTQNSRVSVFGQEVMELTSDDELATVMKYYEQQLGAPVVESQNDDGKNVVFQRPPFMVTLGPSKKYEGKTGITIIRTNLIPSLKEEVEKQKRQY